VPAVVGEVGRGKRKDCHERALGLLAVRQRSRRELERRLSQAGFDEVQIQDSIRRLQAVGLVDDEAFARSVAEHALGHRLEGRRVVARRLAQAGVDPELAREVLGDTGEDEQERADRLAEQRASRLRGLAPDRAFQRLQAFLVRRGYGFDVARRAASRALAVESGED
jgi:regulatory protein